MKKKLINLALSVLMIAALVFIVDATVIYNESYVPKSPGATTARFWTSGTGFVTTSDNDTLAANGSVTSIDITLAGTNGVNDFSTPPSEIYFVGDYVKPTTYPTPCVDSLLMTYYYTDASGEDMQLGGTDTLVIDTTGIVTATVPFVFKLGATEPEGGAFIGAKMRFKLTILDLAPANDTLLFKNCGILRRWTN